MIRFSEMITESKAGKNLHLEHIEDEILNFGVDGGIQSTFAFTTRYVVWWC